MCREKHRKALKQQRNIDIFLTLVGNYILFMGLNVNDLDLDFSFTNNSHNSSKYDFYGGIVAKIIEKYSFT